MKKEEKEYNLSEYAYKDGDMVELPAKDFVGLITLLQDVFQDGEVITFTHPSMAKSQEEYFSQRDLTKSITPLAFTASYFLMGMKSIHLENIKNGKAVKLGEIKNEEKAEFSK